jgi:hypothetical protein
MSYSEVLKVSDDGKFRVRLIQDDDASEPYDDGQSPLLRLEYTGYRWRAEHVMATGRPTGNDERIEEAAQKWGGELDKFEKYLRAYYGTREIKIDTSTSRDFTYITYDTAEWREAMGFEPDAETPHPLINMDEYLAWCVGDCYGYVVEENTTWHKDGDPDSAMTTWERTDEECWGFYGEYGREAALEAFDAFITDIPEPAKPTWADELWANFVRDFRQQVRQQLKIRRRARK